MSLRTGALEPRGSSDVTALFGIARLREVAELAWFAVTAGVQAPGPQGSLCQHAELPRLPAGFSVSSTVTPQ